MLFFTGLSGSGKSTLARALMDRLLEQGGRTRDQPRRRRRTPAPVGRADLLQGGPRDQHPPDRLGGRRDRPARRRRGVQPDRAVRRDPASRCGRWSRTPAARSSSSTSPPRSRSASAATARASTPRPGAARSPSSPASPRPTRSRRTPPCASTPPAAPSRTPSTTSSSALRDAGYLDLTDAATPVVEVRAERASRPGTPTARPQGPLRLHRQHLPLAVHGAGDPAPARPGLRDRGVQRRHPRLRRPSDERGDGRRATETDARRLPQPAR